MEKSCGAAENVTTFCVGHPGSAWRTPKIKGLGLCLQESLLSFKKEQPLA